MSLEAASGAANSQGHKHSHHANYALGTGHRTPYRGHATTLRGRAFLQYDSVRFCGIPARSITSGIGPLCDRSAVPTVRTSTGSRMLPSDILESGSFDFGLGFPPIHHG
jgi:hypothetical protein